MYSKVLKEIQTQLSIVNNPALTEYVAQMSADMINQEMSGKMTKQDCLNSLEALWLGLDRRIREANSI